MSDTSKKFTKMRYAFTTMEPTPSNIMTDYETTRDDILQHIYPILIHESKVNDDIVALRIDGIIGLRVVFMMLQTRQLLSKTTQLKYRIKPSDLVTSINRNNYHFTFSKMSELLGISCPNDEDLQMYVLTNPQQNCGSGLITNNKILRHILDKVGEDIYVLPSSIHELIIIPASFTDDERYLTEMVYGINQNEVEPNERLSNDVYRVDYVSMKFRTIQYRP